MESQSGKEPPTVARKVLVACVAVLLVSGGLCGVQLLILHGAGRAPDSLTAVFMLTGAAELIAMSCAVVVGLGALLVWIVGNSRR